MHRSGKALRTGGQRWPMEAGPKATPLRPESREGERERKGSDDSDRRELEGENHDDSIRRTHKSGRDRNITNPPTPRPKLMIQ